MKKSLFQSTGRFYKANLHTHTIFSDGALTPAQMKDEYRLRDYDVVAFSDHEIQLSHYDELADEQFLPLTAVEAEFKNIDDSETPKFLKKLYHMIYISPTPEVKYFPWPNRDIVWGRAKDYVQDEYQGDCPRDPEQEIVNRGSRDAHEHGFLVTYCHPGWSVNRYPDYEKLEDLDFVEVYNSGCAISGRPGDESERPFDDLLSLGQHVAPTASDDSHSKGQVGYGATYIKADELTYDSIFNSLKNKDCFASTGPRFEDISFDPETMTLEVCADPVEVISVTTNTRYKVSKGKIGAPLVDHMKCDISEFVEGVRKMDLFDQSFIRVNLYGLGGKRAYSRGYFLTELLPK